MSGIGEGILANFITSIVGKLFGVFKSIVQKCKLDNVCDEIIAAFEHRLSLPEILKYLNIQYRDIRAVRSLGIANWSMTTEILADFQKHEISITLLCLDPESESAINRCQEERQDVDFHVLNVMRELSESSDFSMVHIHLYDKIPRFNIILIDGKNDKKDSYALVQHYSYIRGGSSPQFVIRKYKRGQETTLYRYYEKIYNDVDAKGYPIEKG